MKILKIHLLVVAFMSLAATGVLAHWDYVGKVHELWMWKHLTWPTWVCFAIFFTSYTWQTMIQEEKQ